MKSNVLVILYYADYFSLELYKLGFVFYNAYASIFFFQKDVSVYLLLIFLFLRKFNGFLNAEYR